MEKKDKPAQKPDDVVEAKDRRLLPKASLTTMRTLKTLKRRAKNNRQTSASRSFGLARA